MTDEIDDIINAMRAVLMRTVKPNDRSAEVAVLKAANDALHHRIKCLETENRGLYAKLELLRGERSSPTGDPGS